MFEAGDAYGTPVADRLGTLGTFLRFWVEDGRV